MPKKKRKSTRGKNKLSAEALEEALWDTLNKVKNKKMDISQANSVVGAAKEINNVSRLQIQYAALTGDPIKKIPTLVTPKKPPLLVSV